MASQFATLEPLQPDEGGVTLENRVVGVRAGVRCAARLVI